MGKSTSSWKGYERELARQFSVWWYGAPGVLRRAPVSGGWPRKGSLGDIIVAEGYDSRAPDAFPFCVEAKNRPTQFHNLSMLLTGEECPLFKWWSVLLTVEAVTMHHKLPLLISKAGHGLDLVFMGRETMLFLVDRCGSPDVPWFRFKRQDLVLAVMKLDHWFEWLDNPQALGAPRHGLMKEIGGEETKEHVSGSGGEIGSLGSTPQVEGEGKAADRGGEGGAVS